MKRLLLYKNKKITFKNILYVSTMKKIKNCGECLILSSLVK